MTLIINERVNFKNIPQYFSPKHFVQIWRSVAPRLPKAIVLGVVVGLVGILISPFHFALNLEENSGLGLLFKLRGAKDRPG